ncbi:hypothetical protein DFJ74DRAFT_669084 [Hyaloraphidium curvatum]|nr:hypothetical protein DFJ74DRAFT_669084 [Hyaloraphidium curvatum]
MGMMGQTEKECFEALLDMQKLGKDVERDLGMIHHSLLCLSVVLDIKTVDDGQGMIRKARKQEIDAGRYLHVAISPPVPDSCDLCGTEGKLSKCGRCRVALYCGPDCQRQHWAAHKLKCFQATS